MSFPSRFLLSASFCAVAVAALAQTPPPVGAPPVAEKIERLDKFVVSAGPDPKTSFDLAQGTTVLAADDLRRAAQATLGETLASTPGVASTYYGPGASRPVIRGLGGDRIRVLANGVGALDAANVSPDHNGALEPLFASSIEVLRGPGTLLYGSSAVGGVVNVLDNAIPDAPPVKTPAGALELRGGGAARERTAVLAADAGGKTFALHLNALRQKNADLRIPGVARIDPDAPARQAAGTLPDSAADRRSVALGGSLFWAAGHAGAALSRYETTYGVPTGDTPPISIRMKQTRLDLAGEVTQAFGPFRRARARFGFGDYTHAELSGGSTVNTTFVNRAWEGRLEAPHAPLGRVTGTVGVQAARSDFSATGEEVVTPPTLTHSGAVFAVEEMKLGGKTTLQFGARAEAQAIRLGEVDAGLPALPGYAARSGERKRLAGLSGSTGLVFYPAKDWSVGVALAYTERLPTAQELFSNGPHSGTDAYEVGTSGLGREKSLGFDVSLRRRAGFVTGAISAFAHRFDDYIFEQELPLAAIPEENNEDGLTPFQFAARNARFHGAEAELSFHLLDRTPRRVHLDLMGDLVRAQQAASREPLPRIPAARYGARLSYEDGRWSVHVEWRRTARQNRLAATETPTAGYTLVHASIAWLVPAGRVNYEFFLRGQNLTNANARAHSSFLKDVAPLPGRGVLGGVRVGF